tara:strand:- start:388 stop:1041 length:654 start_codon:yes stop_codon:yes gene_type:complete
MSPLISFLIPTLKEREKKFKSLSDKIYLQIEENNLQEKVEVLSICDNRNIKLSVKRNMLQKMCKGSYFIHLDDDDRVADDYCKTLCDVIEKLSENSPYGSGNTPVPDCITYNQMCEVNKEFFIVKCNPYRDMGLTLVDMNDGLKIFERVPWQFCLWNKARFSHIYRTDVDTNAREDQNWLKKVYLEYPKTFYNIDKVLHYYYFDKDGTGENKTTCQL